MVIPFLLLRLQGAHDGSVDVEVWELGEREESGGHGVLRVEAKPVVQERAEPAECDAAGLGPQQSAGGVEHQAGRVPECNRALVQRQQE